MDKQAQRYARFSIQSILVPLLGLAIILGATYYLGWQRALGRTDPAFALPWIMPVIFWVIWSWRDGSFASRASATLLFSIALLAAQWSFASWQSEAAASSLIGPHLIVIAIGLLAAGIIASLLLPLMRRSGLWRGGIFIAITILSFFISHISLATLYRPVPMKDGEKAAVVITGLPLRWSGSADIASIFSGASVDDPALTMLETMGPVRLVDSLAGLNLSRNTPLLLIHPRALSPQDLVRVDDHVQAGGKAIILADALSSWHVHHALGDARNPPITSLLTPLLDHWGITLDAVSHGQGDEIRVAQNGYALSLYSAGRFSRFPSACQSYTSDYILHCPIGAGQIWLIGDADLLRTKAWQQPMINSPHLAKSDIFPWLAVKIWGEESTAPILRALWVKRASHPIS